MHRLLAALLIAAPAPAEWLALELTFQGAGCAPCVESLPSRIQRMRGVESAEVDAPRGILRIKLAPGNRVRLELVRDQVEQDGTKVTSARVEGNGVIEREGGQGMFRLDGLPLSYKMEGITGAPGEQPVVLKANTTALRPEVTLRAVEIKPRD